MTPREQIVHNLEQRVHPVSVIIAIKGIDDMGKGFTELKLLVTEGIIERTAINRLAFYQYNRYK